MIYIQKIARDTKQETPQHKLLHDCAHALLQQAVEAEYPKQAHKLTMRRQEHGKPYFVEKTENGMETYSDICFNLTHSGEYAACILGQGAMGIDVERVRPYNQKVAKRILHEREYQVMEASKEPDSDFIRFWTLKEAYGKYTGKGIGENLRQVMFQWKESGDILCSDEKVEMYQWQIEKEYYLAVCVPALTPDIKSLTKINRSDKIYTC